jgi:hypothetical protein
LKVSDIKQAQLVLNGLIQKYNYKWIHFTTGEIPYIKFQRAYAESKSLFREFRVRSIYKSTKDIFCLRADRLELRVSKASLHKKIQL